MSEFSDDHYTHGLDVYLVGGAVRDRLLKRSVVDRDWVVVGSCAEDMLARGFTPVGSDFPVFLHPESHEEYALARTERKTRSGHQGFEFQADQAVTLEQDLMRRDFTINAIAMSADGNLIDPYQGRSDIEKGLLHPVSDAFAEDPLRILRAARFMAQMPQLQVSDTFTQLLPRMQKELASLSVERVWQEAFKSFGGQPERFFQALTQWNLWADLGLEAPNIPNGPFSGSAEDRLVQWLWRGWMDDQRWMSHWKAPKRWEQLHRDIVAWHRDEAFDALRAAGALKKTPRSQQLIDAIHRHSDIDLEAALNAARSIRADQMPKELSGPALGQALIAAQRQAFNAVFSR